MNSPKAVYLLPNLMTAGNLFCGFMAILQIFEGTMTRRYGEGEWWVHFELSLLLIIGAFVCDILDGRLARLGGQESPFGREFDSLADIVSFGMAPALLLFQIVLYEMPNRIGWLIAFIYLACGALRLARFNTLQAIEGSHATKSFTGFPIPAAAGLIASITLLLLKIYEADPDRSIGVWKFVLAGLMIFLSFMMFSKVEYPSFKNLDWKSRRPVSQLLAIVILIGLIVMYWRYALAVCFFLYLLYGFLRPYLPKQWNLDLDTTDSDDDITPLKSP
ncbi:MAG: CDP-diacylglycerol--serine O-phosphatidyltransferase [Verrucomicrobiota bacterium]